MNRTMLGLAVLAVLAVLGCADAAAQPREGPRPATAADLVGRWYPADGTAQGRAFAEFTADGGWTGSDGCNGQRGTWTVRPDGTFAGTAGPSTLIGCENVPIAFWISGGARAEIDGEALVLRDGAGAELGRMVPELP
ncbi:META domain-containing protein [Pseudonocardia sp. C8]|uniref:META domain-containing protein n=1 Tax=Pseudonocardia sp. C8 TaxID=2762759 RepID=UPI0016424145|nr:META domain-containing protein [Pseudonocardia sp. C8]MBC3190502.1 META domain-containing protein [Pseudonocardia sp. C8]